jgi:tetratricopeptide (TPR) repeat protein
MRKLIFGTQFVILFLLNGLTIQAQPLETKKAVLTIVFNKIIYAYGNAKAPPVLEIVPSKTQVKYIASYVSSPTPTIKIDEQLYDICTKYGNDSLNALSIILSHELAHYYNDHSWCSDYAFAVRGKIKITKEDKVTHEREADNFGLYHSCIAGYEPFHIYDKLIDRIYKDYKLQEINPGYPSKSERKVICDEAEKKIKELYPYFTKGLEEIQKKQFASAIQCFEYLNRYFPSRENYNNAGTAKTLWALQLKPLERVEYINPLFRYPIEIDADSRIKVSGNRTIDEDALIMDSLLISAKSDFEKSIHLDPKYTKAYINLACVYDLLGNPEAAIGKIKELPKKEQNSRQAFILLGIAYYHTGNEILSKEYFDKSKIHEKK